MLVSESLYESTDKLLFDIAQVSPLCRSIQMCVSTSVYPGSMSPLEQLLASAVGGSM